MILLYTLVLRVPLHPNYLAPSNELLAKPPHPLTVPAEIEVILSYQALLSVEIQNHDQQHHVFLIEK